MSSFNENDLVDFGDVPAGVNVILQEGVLAYRHDRAAADAHFKAALALDPSALASYFCLFKIHTYQGRLDDALAAARAGLEEASRQAGLLAEWTLWTREAICGAPDGPVHFALYTLKAMAFIHLKRKELDDAQRCLAKLAALGALDAVGGSVVAELAEAVA